MDSNSSIYTQFCVMKYWHRLSHMEEGRLTRDVFKWSESLADTGAQNWASRTRSLFQNAELLESSLIGSKPEGFLGRGMCASLLQHNMRKSSQLTMWQRNQKVGVG